MIVQSTRGGPRLEDTRAVLAGIAADGGLFVDASLAGRRFDWRACLREDSLGMAERILRFLLPGFEDMHTLVRRAYAGKFETEDLTPLVRAGEDYVLELFRGPTSAFKDVALSMLPQLISAAREQEGVKGETVILTATSGDTGKAALQGFCNVPGTRIIVFYPDGGVSPVQRLQMATQEGANVRVCAVRGNFDDCQTGVKRAFAAIREGELLRGTGRELSSANSINIGRLAPQVVYYFIAYAKLLRSGRIREGDEVDFVVPTGNFGDILAGWLAKRLGLPVGRLVCASNANRVLTDFFETGVYDRRREFVRTTSPSMDILVSSNLERLLFYASDGDAAFVRGCMDQLSQEGAYRVPERIMARIRAEFSACCCTEAETEASIARVWRETGYLCDPHTAVAMHAAREYRRAEAAGRPIVVLSTASPYKFPGPVLRAVGGSAEGDEFAQMRALNRLSGVPVPAGLSNLDRRPILHRDLIDREEMLDYILSVLKEGRS